MSPAAGMITPTVNIGVDKKIGELKSYRNLAHDEYRFRANDNQNAVDAEAALKEARWQAGSQAHEGFLPPP